MLNGKSGRGGRGDKFVSCGMEFQVSLVFRGDNKEGGGGGGPHSVIVRGTFGTVSVERGKPWLHLFLVTNVSKPKGARGEVVRIKSMKLGGGQN